MSELPPADPSSPPLVLRVEPDPVAPAVVPPRRPRPGLVEAVCWCLLFLATQLFGLVLVATGVFGVYALRVNDPQVFVRDVAKFVSATTGGPAVPVEHPLAGEAFCQAIASGVLGAQVFSLLLILLVVPRRVGPDWKRQLGLRAPSPLLLVFALVALPAFMILPDLLARWMKHLLGDWSLVNTQVSTGLRDIFARWPGWLVALAIGVGPGLVEEFWCRGFLGRGLVGRYGFVAGVLLTSVLFGLLHLDPQHARITAVMGVYLHFLYFVSRSIWVPVVVHAGNNALGVLMELDRLPKPQLDGSPLEPVVYLVCFALLVFASAAMWTGRARLVPATVNDPTWNPEYPGVSAPPPDADVVIGHAPPSPVAVVFTAVSFAALVFLLTR